MRSFSIALCVQLWLLGIWPSAAQLASPEVPLTSQVIHRLTVEQAARRLLGPSGQIVSKVLIGPPPVGTPPEQPLSLVRFFTTPRASEPGLCQQNEIDVQFDTEDGSPMRSATGSTPMKISSISGGFGYMVVGDLNARPSNEQRRMLDQTCARVDNILGFFSAPFAQQAWEVASLVEAAITEMRARNPRDKSLNCDTRQCDDMNASFDKLSATGIFGYSTNCNRVLSDWAICYSVRLVDPLNYYRAWSVTVETDIRPPRKLQKSTFTLVSEPVI